MRILLTGVTGYIGKRLLPVLLNDGHEVICCVRDRKRFDSTKYQNNRIKVIELDFLERSSIEVIPDNIDVAYYLIHSLSTADDNFETLERKSAENFRDRIQQTQTEQVIYLSGIINSDKLSKHLHSRKQVEEILSIGKYHLTTLRAGIIVGSGSASFEIMRDLVEKLPIMIAPKWLNTETQPIAIRNVIELLYGVLLREETFDRSFDIGGSEILTYKDMLLKFAKVRNLKRRIITVPVMTPRLSSYWLYFITSISYHLAVNLVNSMKVKVVCRDNRLQELLGIKPLSYEEAIRLAFDKIEQQEVRSSWTDALTSDILKEGISKLIEVPIYGCYQDKRYHLITNKKEVLNKIWAIGGQNGWYYANWLWNIRGFIDKLFGGVGLRRGRKNNYTISAGDSLDFWRVLYANKKEKRLLLYAEMKLPGEAWLEFKIVDDRLYQIATYRPLGILGRMYWYILLPIHKIIFKGMIKSIASVEA